MSDIPYWKQQQLEAESKKKIAEQYPDLGKIVRYQGETGIVILGSYCRDGSSGVEEVVRWDTPKEFDNEQYGFFPYTYLDSYEFKYINPDGTLKKK
jgi:hypothetical protein